MEERNGMTADASKFVDCKYGFKIPLGQAGGPTNTLGPYYLELPAV